MQGSRVVKSAPSTSSLHDLYELLYHTFGYSYCLIRGGRTRICVGSYRRPHRHLAFVLNSFASLLMRRSESRAFRDHAPGPVSKFFGFFMFLWCMHGLSKFWLDSSKPFLILERVVPVAAMKFLLLLVAAARSAETRFRFKQRVFYLEEAIYEQIRKYMIETYLKKYSKNDGTHAQVFSGLTSIQQHSCIVGVNRRNKMTHRKVPLKEGSFLFFPGICEVLLLHWEPCSDLALANVGWPLDSV